MDLGTIDTKLKTGKYSKINEVLYDIGLVWDNCKLYNRENSLIYRTADKMEKLFQKRVKLIRCAPNSTRHSILTH